MRLFWAYRWFYLPAGIFMLAVGMLAWSVPYGHEILFFNQIRVEPFNSIFRFFSFLGESWLWVVAGLAALFLRYRFTLIIAMAGLIIIPLAYVVKDKVGTDRPITYFNEQGMAEYVVTVPEVRLNRGQTSFPSGHTMSAFGLFSLLALMAGPDRRAVAFGLVSLASMIGISRIFLVQHFLVDVLGGAALGLAVSSVVWWMSSFPFFSKQSWLDSRIGGSRRIKTRTCPGVPGHVPDEHK